MTVRILFVEDSQDDVDLQLRRLREAGLAPQWDRVQTEGALRTVLDGESWHVALVDYNIPGFSGVEALRLIAELAPDLPAITVSGSIDEDTAVATMSAGAVDYVLKDNLTRLAPAVRRAVDGADLRRAHRQAAESAHLALFVLDHASLAITTAARDGTVVYVNDYACRVFGLPRDEFVGRKLWEIEGTVQGARWLGMWDAVLEGRVVESRVDCLTGSGRRLVLDITTNYLDDAGLVISYGRDVTGRVEAEERVLAEQTSLAAIFEASPVAMLVFDDRLHVVRANRAALRLAGCADERLLEHRSDSDVHCGDVLGCAGRPQAGESCETSPQCPLCPLHDAVAAALAGGVSLRGVELTLDSQHDGEIEVKWLRIGAEPMLLNGVPHVTVAVDDITDRRRAKTALKESEERFRLFAEQIPGIVTIKDADRRYLYVSSLWGATVEGGEEAWLGRRPEDLWSPEEVEVSKRSTVRALAGEMVDEVMTMRRGDQLRHLHSLHFPIPRDGASPLVGGLMLDVTEQVEAQEQVRRQAEQLRRTVEGTVLAMSQVVETRDPYTAGHERRVAELAAAIASEMGMRGAELDGLRLGALIHDIGKISVPAEILAKPGRLSPVEFNLIKQHSQAGYEILSVIDFGRLVAEMVLQHHERLDGSGYPNGLAGDGLLPETRILVVADVVEAMSSHRPYRPALGIEAALAEIREGAGTRYDPEVAAACDRVITRQGFRFSP